MPKRSRQNKANLLLLKVFAFAIVFVVLMAGLYYRHQINVQQIQQQELLKQRAMQSRQNFVKVIAPIAQAEDKPYGILPSVTIAQACLESNYGQSDLAKKYNNLFGVKGTDPNTSQVMTTQEFVNGHWETIHGRFQIYDSYQASIHAHTLLFVNGTSWNSKQYQHVLAAKDYRSQAKALEMDGYATDPGYANKVISIIEQYNLTQYDN